MDRRSWLAGMAAASLLGPRAAFAQAAATYPNKPIRILIPLPPGGVTDGMARLVAQRLQDVWGQPVVPENRPGGSHFIAAEAAAKSAPDGYTLFFGNHQSHAMNSGLFTKMPYDPLKDFVPVTLLVTSANVLVARPNLPANNVRELVALARQKPGVINYGSQGTGSSGHVGAAMVGLMSNVSLVHVPYKGPAAATQDLLGGQIDILFDTVFSQLSNIRAGKLKALGISSAQRSPLLPDVPTVAEQGLAGFEVIPWFGLFAPAGTPRDVVDKLNAEAVKIVNDPAVKSRLAEQGLVTVGNSPAQFAQFVTAENAKWTKLIRDMKISAE